MHPLNTEAFRSESRNPSCTYCKPCESIKSQQKNPPPSPLYACCKSEGGRIPFSNPRVVSWRRNTVIWQRMAGTTSNSCPPQGPTSKQPESITVSNNYRMHISVPVGFNCVSRQCAARALLIVPINMQTGALRSLPRPSQLLSFCYTVYRKYAKIPVWTKNPRGCYSVS